MNAVDTNVLLYSLDDTEPAKQAKARQLLYQLLLKPADTMLPWQALAELVGQLRRWLNSGKITAADFQSYVPRYRSMFPIAMPTPAVLDRALDLTDRFSLSHWDSMLLAACIEAGADRLYTEDMGAPIQYDSVQLLNPIV